MTYFSARIDAQFKLTQVYLRCIEQEWTAARMHREMDNAEREFWNHWPDCDLEKAEVRGFANGLKAALWQGHINRCDDGVYCWPSGEFWKRETVD